MIFRLLFSICVVCVICGSSSAASPSLGGIQPRGAQRGTEAVLTFSGARLADAQEVLANYPGVAVKKMEVVNDATLKVTVAIAPDCRLGEHAFLNLGARLARKLCALSVAHGRHEREEVTIDVKLSQTELAQMLGVTREAVNKQLQNWSRQGVLRFERGYITIADQKRMQAFQHQ